MLVSVHPSRGRRERHAEFSERRAIATTMLAEDCVDLGETLPAPLAHWTASALITFPHDKNSVPLPSRL